MKQWQGMNSSAYNGGSRAITYCGSDRFYTGTLGNNLSISVTDSGSTTSAAYGYAYNTGYTGGSSTASYYNDCTACCAD